MTKLFDFKERWILVGFLFLGIVGAVFFTLFFKSISPAASLNFQVSRPQAREQGEQILKRLGLDPALFHCSITFQSDDDEAVYVEKTLGTEKANSFFETELAPWFWKLRWFQPLKEEEMALAISPNGKIVGYRHKIEEDAGGGFLSKEEAENLAGRFLKIEAGLSLNQWKLISSEQEDKKDRRDHLFIWEKSGIQVGEAPIQMSCGVQGNRVTSYSRYINIPESFAARREQTAANRNLLTRITSLFYIALGIFVGGEFLLSLKQHNFRWKIPLLLAGGMFALTLLSNLNSLPLELASLDTRESYSHFLLNEILSNLLEAFWAALFILMVAVGADNLQRATWPGKERLIHIFSGAYFQSKNYIRSVIVGYSLGALQLGYVAAYYLFTKKILGGWSPLESPYYNVASSTLPWVFPLTIGLTAALNEELFFRMFSISLLKRVLRFSVPAVLIPAVIWGFLHSNYYVEPIYNRGVELGLVGIVLGAVFLRYGVVPVILCHYTYNSVLGFIPLLRSESLFFKTSGWISLFWILLPALIACVAYLKLKQRGVSGEFVIPPEEERAHVPLKESRLFRLGRRLGYEFFGVPPGWKGVTREALPMEKPVLRASTFWWIAGLSVALLALMLRFLPLHYGPSPEASVGKEKAVEMAQAFFKKNKITNPFQDPLVVFFREPYSAVGTYLLRHKGMEKTNQISQEERFSFLRWGVVFYKLGDPNRLTASVDAQGRVVGYQASRGETESLGGALSEEEALAKAGSLLQLLRPADWKQFRYSGSKAAILKNRTDYAFVWEKKLAQAPELIFRILIRIHGWELGGYEENISVPEPFVRELKEKRTLDTVVMLIVAILVLVGSVWVALDAVFKFRLGEYPWKSALKLGLVFLACDLVEKINSWQDVWVSLVEANPLTPTVFLAEKIINLVLGQLTTFGFIVFFSAFALALIRERFGAFSFSSFLSPRQWGRLENRQGATLALLFFLLLWVGQYFLTALELKWIPDTIKASYPFFIDTPVNSSLPGLGMLAAAIKESLLYSLTLGALIAFLFKVFKKEYLLFIFIVFTSSLQYISSQFTLIEIGIKIGLHLLILLVLFLGIKKCVRLNLFFYFYFFWARSLIPHLFLARFSDPFLAAQGIVAGILLVLPLALVWLATLRRHEAVT